MATTTDIVPFQNKYPVLSPEQGSDFNQNLQETIKTAGISAFDLDRIRVPAGGITLWTIPTLDGDTNEKVFEGIIIFQKVNRTFWKTPLGQGPNGNTPPDCYSDDGVYGMGDPGGDCGTCPLNQFGSDLKAGPGKACRESRLLFVLRPGSFLPAVVPLPPTSLQIAKKYFFRLLSNNAPYWGVTTKFTLTTVQNASGMKYSQVALSVGEKLPNDMIGQIKAYADILRPAFMAARAERTDTEVSPDEPDTSQN